MTTVHPPATTATREEALAVRQDVINTLTRSAVRSIVADFGSAAYGVAAVAGELDERTTSTLCREFDAVDGWSSETWSIAADGAVSLVSEEEFQVAPATERFSFSDCLRRIPDDALAVRGLLSGLKSDPVTTTLSEALGEQVRFASADVARYREGHYLRRHADTYEERRFGFVFFVSDGWRPGAGGELIVEGPHGDSYVFGPVAGRIAALRIAPGYQHQVARIQDEAWCRYSVAAHFRGVD